MSKLYDTVVFHYPCQDGLTSAWIVWKYHKLKDIDITLYPIQHGVDLDINKFKDNKVIFCDYSPSLEVLNLIEMSTKEICILDHHISAQRVLENKKYAIFDMNYSGAGLTWLYFFPTIEMPLFIQYIQDRDLWTWKLEGSKEFTAGFSTICETYNMKDFDSLFSLFDNIESKMDYYKEIGTVMNNMILSKARAIADKHITTITKYKGYNVCIVNCIEYVSEVGSIITSNPLIDFAVLWKYNHPTQEYIVSLRANNKVDCSVIAKQYGGGGHKNAAGFTIKGGLPFNL
jgi:nanoRNase/pAp phosphatase (c-di-AMP/oligoRNAs hydrolase)